MCLNSDAPFWCSLSFWWGSSAGCVVGPPTSFLVLWPPRCSVTVVAEAFDGLSMVKRHRMIYQALDQEFKDGLHALSLTTKSVQESS